MKKNKINNCLINFKEVSIMASVVRYVDGLGNVPCFEGIGKMAISEDTKMKAKILKCSNDGARYESMIGDVIEVGYFSAEGLSYEIPSEKFLGYVSIEDLDISDGKKYSTMDVINYCSDNPKSYFVNLSFGNNQAMIVRYNEMTGMFEDVSRRNIRVLSPEQLIIGSMIKRSYELNEQDTIYTVHCYDSWTRLVRDYFIIKI